jgi:hypothetical protein
MRTQKLHTQTDQARAIHLALEVLTFIAGRDSDLEQLMVETGIGGTELLARAGDPELLAGLMDFLLNNEPLLIAFASEANIDPLLPARMRQYLPGWAEA